MLLQESVEDMLQPLKDAIQDPGIVQGLSELDQPSIQWRQTLSSLLSSSTADMNKNLKHRYGIF